MPPLPVNNTGRVFVDYVANGRSHTGQFRYSGTGAPTEGFLESLDDIFLALNPLMPEDWAFTGWRYSAAGLDYSVPLAGAPTTFNGAASVSQGRAPAFYSIVGRSPEGKRARIYLLGAGFSPAESGGFLGNYRWTSAENGQVADVLNAVIASNIVAIDGLAPAWKNYFNLGYNAYWQGAIR